VLRQAAQAIPERLEVVLLAGRGFCDLDPMRLLTEDLPWHRRGRLKDTFLVYRKGRAAGTPLYPGTGQAVFWHHVLVGRERWRLQEAN